MFDDEAARQLETAADQVQRLGRILYSRLNFFKAAGLTWSELGHSNFLAFLLTPTENHKMGDRFLRSFLYQVATKYPTNTALPSPSELSSWTLDDTQVFREKDHIDILLLNFRLGIAVIVENKTGSQEHGDQLQRYWNVIARESRRTPRVIGLFLSPSHATPSHPKFMAISYRTVHRALEDVRSIPELSEFPEVKMILRHYSQLVEGEFMDQSESHASTIAWEIHRKYRRAIDFLNENPPSQQIKNEIKVNISETEGCSFEKEKRDEISFVLQEWRHDPLLVRGALEYSSAWLFWFEVFDDRLILWLGADPQSSDAADRLKALARLHPNVFPAAEIGRDVWGWPTIWSREFLNSSDFRQLEREQIFAKIRDRWQIFRERSLPALRTILLGSPGANTIPK